MSATDILGRPIRLLVVDDDATVALMAKMALSDFGFEVRTVASGDAARDAIQRQTPDIIVLDLVLPGTSGFEICREVRNSPAGHQIPIVIASSNDDTASIEAAYQEGATTFVNKPINWAILRHQLQYLLRAARDRARLAESEERYALAAAGANDGLWDWNIAQDTAYFSPRWREQLKLREADLGGKTSNWFSRIHPDDQLGFHNELNAHLAGQTPKLEIEYRVRDRDDTYRWMLCRALAIRDGDGNPYRIAGSQTDITERKDAEQQVLHDALHDPLTGLANRRLLLERISHAIKLARRRVDYAFAVAIIDLDRFKTINDSLGHLAGDSLLRRIGERIAGHLRASDTLAHLGGDEFAILFDDFADFTNLDHLIERIRHEIAQPFVLMGQEVATAASIGVTLSSVAYNVAEDMLRDADIAMYRAKATGKNRYQVFDSTMHTQVASMLQMESELRAATTRNDFEIHYQPIRHLGDDRIVGFEALLRWRHPAKGELAPEAFIGLAEETGLIVPIGYGVIRQATQQLAAWHQELSAARKTFVAINLSSRQFSHPDLLQHVAAALEDSGLPAEFLRLEITESVLIDNTRQAAQVLQELKQLGVRTIIDDFGTGYSSFSYLHRLPFDALKIDRSFVAGVDRDTKSREIVRAIVSLAQNLGLAAIAEGGETQQEVAYLQSIGCEFNQGFAFSKAISADKIVEFVRRHCAARLKMIDGGKNA